MEVEVAAAAGGGDPSPPLPPDSTFLLLRHVGDHVGEEQEKCAWPVAASLFFKDSFNQQRSAMEEHHVSGDRAFRLSWPVLCLRPLAFSARPH